MKNRLTTALAGLLALGAAGLTSSFSTAHAADNTMYGEVRFGQLPLQGKMAHAPWVGSWWAYTRNGISYRHKLNSAPECRGVDANATTQALVDQGKSFCLSAAEKIDVLKGRAASIEWDAIKTYHQVTEAQLGPKQDQLRTLVRKLNKYIADNPDKDWRETDDGKAYVALNTELDTAKANLPAITVDTATEFEQLEHGKGVPGVQGWWGHCNAWSAASLMEAEPRKRGSVTENGVTVEFTPGEVKALLTEAWMEHASSFFGSRSEEPDNTGNAYADLTPAAFHIFFATQLGLQHKGFVIDRFTGSEVWNQPVRSYVSRFEKLYTDAPVKTKVAQTEYDRRTGNPTPRDLGEIDVYPIQVTTSFHWVTDGLPHEELTVGNVLEDAYPTSSSEAHRLWGSQIEMRTLTYTLYLDKPADDPAARVVGDGVWSNAMAKDDHAWPDFAWQPLSQGPSVRKYENPNIEYAALIESKILPATLETPAPAGMGSMETTAKDTPKDIPDNAAAGVSSTLTVAEGGKILTAVVKVDITHPYVGDLRVVLQHAGQSIVLHDRAGGSDDDIKRSFDAPQLAGLASTGEWTLSVFDGAAQDVGKINGWSVELVTEGAAMPPPAPAAPTTGKFTGAGTPIAIPDNKRAGITSLATSNGTGALTSVKVTVDITHPYSGDLVVTLVRNGESIVLQNKVGGGADDIKKSFDVPSLAGKPAGGEWTLKVQDLAKADVGTLNGWTLDLAWR